MSKKIKVNDKVIIITGKYKGKVGKLLKFLNKNYVLVENINLYKKKDKSNNFILKESKIHISNIAYFNTNNNYADKIKFSYLDGKKNRILKSNNEIIND